MENNTQPVQPANIEPKDSIFSSKGILIAVLLGAIALGFGIFSLFSLGSSSEYQGMINKVQIQTQKLSQ